LSKKAFLTLPATKIPVESVQVILFRERRLQLMPTDTTKTVGSNGGKHVPATNIA
jgi:hypothetical protein